ncbi:MAG TPA: dihydrolipoyl dehydrogenase [Terriglobales bacterium]|nr:dihydrolipoyl dehydrogenase [Terriglobales bacterium]
MAAGSSPDFDLIVLGAGTGGYTAAFRAAQLGMNVALIDQGKIGGTCLHVGCIPTKALLESAEFLARLKKAREFGILLEGQPGFDYEAIAKRRDQVVKRMWTGLKSLIDKNKVTWIAGRGRFEGPTTIRVALAGAAGELAGEPGAAGERVITAKDVIIATGSRVKSLPGITPDGRRIITSDDVTTKADLPKSIAIVGGGAVGSEFASLFHDLGVAVTLLEYLPGIIPLEDKDASAALERSFTRRGIKVMTKARFDATSVKVGDDGVTLMVGPEGGPAAELKVDQLLVATGRAPNTEDLGLEKTQVELERSFIKVDGWMRTAEPHVYAIGDAIGGLMLAHVAAHEGIVAVHEIAGEDPEPIDYDHQPRATYTHPQVASIGLTEQQCTERGIAIKKGVFNFAAVAKAVIVGETEGFAKVIADANTDEVLGVHLVGPGVTDLIAEAALGMTLEATAWEIGAATHPHPTLAEVIGEAAMAVAGRQINS